MGFVFKRDLAALIQQGIKTQTRRRFQDSDIVTRDYFYSSGDIERVRRLTKRGHYTTLYELNHTYPVQIDYRSKSPFRIKLLGIKTEQWADISQADAIAEGFADPAGFHAKIRELYGDDFDMNAPCWVLEFSLVDKG